MEINACFFLLCEKQKQNNERQVPSGIYGRTSELGDGKVHHLADANHPDKLSNNDNYSSTTSPSRLINKLQ